VLNESKSKPLVSIVMNCFNGEKYLQEAICSILKQTYQNFELIFWDNQSTDNSAVIFNSYDDLRLKYFLSEKHTLLYNARNLALEKSSGEFITFLDVDDFWVPDKLEKQLPLFDDKLVGLVYGNYLEIDEQKGKQQLMSSARLPTGYIVDELLRNYVVGLLTIMIRRSAFDDLKKPFDNRFHIIGDFDLVIRMSVNCKVDCIQDAIASYRRHGGNESQKHRDYFIKEMLIWSSEMRYEQAFKDKQEVWEKYYLYLYHTAILEKIQGVNIVRLFSILTALPLGFMKIKLMMIILMPNFLFSFISKIRLSR